MKKKVVTINLREDTFTPGKRYYERVRKCLERNFQQKFNVIAVWDPPEKNLCPSSIASWFHDQQYHVSVCHEKFLTRIQHSSCIPLIMENGDINKFFEWIGIFSLDGDIKNGDLDDYLNSYCCPSPNISVDNIIYIECMGFFTRSKITHISSTISNILHEKKKSIPWASLHIHGFADSPVCWNLKEHTYFTDGDNSFTIIYQPSGDYIVQKSLSSNNQPRIVL